MSRQYAEALWARVGGAVEEVPGGRRHGPADPAFPPPGGPWEPLWSDGRLVGWAPPGAPARAAGRRAVEEGERILAERRSRLLGRLGHKLRSSVLSLQESARQAAFGHPELLSEVYEQAQDVARRALAMEVVARDQRGPSRSVVIGAVLNQAASGAVRVLPDEAIVRVCEPVLIEALTRAYEWMGGPGSTFRGTVARGWLRLEISAAPGRRPLQVPEMGEPLVRHLVETLLDGWLDACDAERAVIHLPAAAQA